MDSGSTPDSLGLLPKYSTHVNIAIVTDMGKRFHIQLSRPQQVPLTNLNHRTPFGNATPFLMQ